MRPWAMVGGANKWMRLGGSLLCGAWLTQGAPVLHARDADSFTVTVRLQVARAIAPRVLSAVLRDEAESLWRPYGVQLAWSADAGVADGDEANGFSIDATIEHSMLSPWVAVLGNASIGLVTPRQPIRVSFDATERVLARRIPAPTQQVVRDRDLARALGRVLAHEIGHVLLAAPTHDAAGLMRANFTATDLAGGDRSPFRLLPDDVARLHNRVRALTAIGPAH